MTQIQLKTNGASLTAKASGKITSGTVGMPVLIEYDDSWDGLTKTAMFRVSEFSRKRENIGTYTTVPWEVLRIPGQRLEIGLEGRDANGEIVVPTVWASVGTVFRGASSGISAAPNPDNGEVPSGGGAVIDDSEVSLGKTWSSQKISDEIKGNAGSNNVKSVNGNYPDENGNVEVTSTCDLEQPRWGVEMLISVPGNGRNGYTLPMVKEEYDRLMRKCSAGEIRYRDGETEPIDISEIYHGMYDDTDPGGPKEPCLMYINGGGDNSDLILYGECAKIPSMYLDVPDIEQPELPSQDAEIIEGKLEIETYESDDGSTIESHRFYKVVGRGVEGNHIYEDEPLKGETGKIYVDVESGKIYRYPWHSEYDYDNGYGEFVEIANSGDGGSGEGMGTVEAFWVDIKGYNGVYADTTKKTTFSHDYDINDLLHRSENGEQIAVRYTDYAETYILYSAHYNYPTNEGTGENELESVTFAGHDFVGNVVQVELLANGTGYKVEHNKLKLDANLRLSGFAADAKAVGDKLGDVATALDHIISMQEELIGV